MLCQSTTPVRFVWQLLYVYTVSTIRWCRKQSYHRGMVKKPATFFRAVICDLGGWSVFVEREREKKKNGPHLIDWPIVSAQHPEADISGVVSLYHHPSTPGISRRQSIAPSSPRRSLPPPPTPLSLPDAPGAMHAVCARGEGLHDRLSRGEKAPPPPLFSGHIAGGTHHAFSDRGEGFCVFSDIAVSELFAS